MKKKLLSLLLVMAIMVTSVSMGFGSLVANAAATGGGIEAINAFSLTQNGTATGTGLTGSTITIKSKNSGYKLKLNSISAKLLYTTDETTVLDSAVYINSFTSGIVCDTSGETYTITGSLSSGAGIIRYECNYDLLDTSGNTIYSGMTGYGYGAASVNGEQTGALGSYITAEPSTPGSSYGFGSFAQINTCYVDVPSISLSCVTEVSGGMGGKSTEERSMVLSGSYPSTASVQNIVWTGCKAHSSSSKTIEWFKLTTPSSNYYSFQVVYNGSTYADVEMYYRDDTLKNTALSNFNNYLAAGLEKSYYTEDSWNSYISALDKLALVSLAIAGPNTTYKLACQYITSLSAGSDVATAKNALVPVTADYTAAYAAYDAFVAIKDTTTDVVTYVASNDKDGGTFGTTTTPLYSDTAKQAVEDYVATCNLSLYKCDQLTVDGYTATIKEMTANLAYADAVFTYIDVAIAEYEVLKAVQDADGLYTAATWTAYTSNIETAQGFSRTELKANSQAEINNCLNSIVSAKNDLEYAPADTVALQEQLNTAVIIQAEYDEGNMFTSVEGFDEIWGYFEDFYSVAQEAASYTKERQSDVDTATKNLSIVIKALAKYRVLDVSELERVLALTPEYDKDQYVQTSYTTWSNLRAEGYLFLLKTYVTYTGDDRKTYADLEEMNNIIELIENAYNNLELVKADFTRINELVAQIPTDEVLALYEQDYVDAINNAVKKIDYGTTFDKQSEVDAVADELEAALAALTYENYRDADYTGVEAAIADANALDRTEYENFEIVDDAINAVDYTKKIVEQDEVDAMEKAIRDAMDELEYVLADYADVEAAIAEAEAVENKDWYSNYSRVQNIIDNINWNLKLDEQDTVDAYAAEIRQAIADLKIGEADYTEVNEAIAAAKKIEPLSDFEDEFIAMLDEAIAGVEAGLTKDRQDEVDAMATRIYDVLAVADSYLKPADYSRLDAAIEYAESYNTGEYKNYDDVIPPVISEENINRDLNCRQTDEMQAQIDAIYAAINSLVLKAADYTAVEEAIENARYTYNNGEYAYSTETKQAVEDVIDSINWDYNIKEQSKVDAYVVAIDQALAGLKYERADYTELDLVLADYEAKKEKQEAEGTYTEDSFQAVQDYVEQIDMEITVDRQSEITTIATELQALLDELQFCPADYSRITNAYEVYNSIIKNNKDYYYDEDIAAVEEVYNAVVWDKTKEEQEAVDAWATELENAVNYLKSNMKPADLTALKEAEAAAYAKWEEMTNSGFTLDASTWEPVDLLLINVDNYNEDTRIDEQDDIDALTAEIIAATANMEYKFEIIWDGSGLSAEGSGTEGSGSYIYGFEEGTMSSEVSEMLQFVGSAELKITETINGFGTGTVIEFISTKDGSILAEYTVLVFGDANGDAVIDTFDVAYIAEVVNSGEEPDEITLKVLDLEKDDFVDALDVSKLISIANMDASLKQDGTMETY